VEKRFQIRPPTIKKREGKKRPLLIPEQGIIEKDSGHIRNSGYLKSTKSKRFRKSKEQELNKKTTGGRKGNSQVLTRRMERRGEDFRGEGGGNRRGREP